MAFWSWSLSIIALICFIIADSFFNCSTWYMGFNYHYCAATLRYVRMHQQLPHHFSLLQNILFWVLIAFNVAAPLVTGVISYIETYNFYKPKTIKQNMMMAMIYFQFCTGILLIVSFSFLGVALFRISKHIQRTGFKGKLNRRMLHLHSVSFSLFLLSGLILYYNFYKYIRRKTLKESVVTIRTVCQIIEFIAELALVAIFYEKYQP